MRFRFVLFLAALFAFLHLQAEVPACYKSIEANFFNYVFVSQTLAAHNISQRTWGEIIRELNHNSHQVPVLVHARAKKMQPNPFEPPFHSKEASQVLHEVLYEVFAQTISKYGVTNPNEVKEMFDSLLQQQRQRLIACFGDTEGTTNP